MNYYKLLPLETFYSFLGLLIPRTVLRVAYLYKIIWLVSLKKLALLYTWEKCGRDRRKVGECQNMRLALLRSG